MNLFLYIFFEIILYSFVCYVFLKFVKKRPIIKFIIFSVLMILILLAIAELFNQIDIYLMERNIYIELGHSNLLDVEIWFIFNIIALILIARVFLKKE